MSLVNIIQVVMHLVALAIYLKLFSTLRKDGMFDKKWNDLTFEKTIIFIMFGVLAIQILNLSVTIITEGELWTAVSLLLINSIIPVAFLVSRFKLK